MEKLKQIRQLKANAYQALQQCCENFKEQLQNLYDSLDRDETLLIEQLDLDED